MNVCVKGQTHYLGDKGSESILRYVCCLLSATDTGHGLKFCSTCRCKPQNSVKYILELD